MIFIAQISSEIEKIIKEIDRNRDEGLNALAKLAKTGDKSAIVYLGLYLSEDEKTTDLSLPWLVKADEFGSADAAWNLAMIARERGSNADMRRWIDRAAELGESDAKKIRDNGYDVDAVLKGI